jgi:hypothetical protein
MFSRRGRIRRQSVVLPAPEGAEITNNLPVLADADESG